MSSDPIKISAAFVVSFTGAWLEFYPSFSSDCTKQCKLQIFWYLQNMAGICRLPLIILGFAAMLYKMLGKMRAA